MKQTTIRLDFKKQGISVFIKHTPETAKVLMKMIYGSVNSRVLKYNREV